MRAIIVDDEKFSLNLMKRVISKNESIDIIGDFTSSEEALSSITQLLPDVIFIDVMMPYMDGIELAKKVENLNKDIQIVFISAYDKFAVDAFKVNAVNYILKPITEEELNITVKRLLRNKIEIKGKDNKKNNIQCLGGFKVYVSSGREVIKWPTSKVKELFAYFVYRNGKEIEKWKLCDILWPNTIPKKAEHSLHCTVYRLRKTLKDEGIENIVYYQDGSYKVDFSDFVCDLWQLEKFIKEDQIVNDENLERYNKMIHLYKGALFENEDYIWSIELGEKIDRHYIFMLKNIAKYYIKKKKYIEAKEYLIEVFRLNPFDEEAHEIIMNVYFHLGERIGLIAHYKKLKRLLREELHIPIKESTKKLYETLIDKLT